jgi:hypothetical protein
VRIYQGAGNTVVVLDEQPDKRSGLLFNRTAAVATKLVQQFNLNPIRTTWIEHYPAGVYYQDDEEVFARVLFKWMRDIAHHPQREYMLAEEVEILMGDES